MIKKPTYEELEKRIQELELTESEHKQTEESWQISQLHYSRIEERLKNKYLFFTRSIAGEMLYISPGSEAISGLTPTEIVGKNWKELVPWTPEALEQGQKSEDKLRSGESNVERIEMPMYLKDGELLYLQMEQYALKDNDNSTIKIEGIIQNITEVKKSEKEREKLILKLETALAEVKKLSGLLPICAHCKKIRDDKGYWNQIEGYIQTHSEAKFSHSMCPECSDELYGKEDWYIEMKKE